MKWSRPDNRYLVKGEPGDRVPDILVRLAQEARIGCGSITGIGGVRNVELAYFDLHRREYLPIRPQGILELVSISGNVAWVGDDPIWHLHATVSDREGRVTAGHLVSLEVAVTLECWIDPGTSLLTRQRDETTGLNLLDL